MRHSFVGIANQSAIRGSSPLGIAKKSAIRGSGPLGIENQSAIRGSSSLGIVKKSAIRGSGPLVLKINDPPIMFYFAEQIVALEFVAIFVIASSLNRAG